MAHGSPRLEICTKCNQYTLVPRFSTNNKCPDCKNILKQTTKEELMHKYQIGLFDFLYPNFNQFVKVKLR
jgi:phage FluMu protein Com